MAAEIDVVTDHSSVTQFEVAEWCGFALVLFCLSLWFTRDRVQPLPGIQRLALPGMAVLFLIAALTSQPAWVFAILSVLMVVWRTWSPRSVAA